MGNEPTKPRRATNRQAKPKVDPVAAAAAARADAFNAVRSAVIGLDDRDSLLAIVKVAQARADTLLKPTHEIRLPRNSRPLYLDGTRGTIGRWRYTRNGSRKVEFMPVRGSRAYTRSQGRAWKVSAQHVYNLETGEPLMRRVGGIATFGELED